MNNRDSKYLFLVLLHIALGVFVFAALALAKLYAMGILIFGCWHIFTTKNAKNQALFAAAYAVGAELFLRMTNGAVLYEYGKYSVMIFLILGMFFTGFSRKSVPYWIFLLLLVPAVLLSAQTLSFETDLRKAITFNIIGSVTLFFSALYCYERQVSQKDILKLINALSYPIITVLVYIILYAPSLKDVITNTQSNFETSGGFGPNQVATVLGLGMFCFFVKLLFGKTGLLIKCIDSIIFIVLIYRGIATFSRGGVFTAVVMIGLLVLFVFFLLKHSARLKLLVLMAVAGVGMLLTWGSLSNQTGGLIDKRYANQDMRGREKTSQLTGRETLMKTELQMFWDNPVWGIGVGKNKEYREELTGIESASHNEITRLLAEHGSFGVAALLILFFTPLILYINNKQHIFLLSFFAFWLLTINHAAMRLAAPAFIYALSLLKVNFVPDEEEPVVHREQTE